MVQVRGTLEVNREKKPDGLRDRLKRRHTGERTSALDRFLSPRSNNVWLLIIASGLASIARSARFSRPDKDLAFKRKKGEDPSRGRVPHGAPHRNHLSVCVFPLPSLSFSSLSLRTRRFFDPFEPWVRSYGRKWRIGKDSRQVKEWNFGASIG